MFEVEPFNRMFTGKTTIIARKTIFAGKAIMSAGNPTIFAWTLFISIYIIGLQNHIFCR